VADWFVYQHDGEFVGPWPTETVAHEILNGNLGPEVWVAAPGGERWVRAMDIPVIARLIDAVPTRPKRRDSGMFLTAKRPPAKTLDDVDSAAATLRMPTLRSEDETPTDPGVPPSPPAPNPTPTLESTGNRRRKNG
jgi:hypothetical protein